jgi:hypothetical protein
MASALKTAKCKTCRVIIRPEAGKDFDQCTFVIFLLLFIHIYVCSKQFRILGMQLHPHLPVQCNNNHELA